MADVLSIIFSVLIFGFAIYGAQQFYETYRRQQRKGLYTNESTTQGDWTSEPQTPEEIEEFWRAFAEDADRSFFHSPHTDHDDDVPEDVVKPRKRTVKKTTTKKPRSAKE